MIGAFDDIFRLEKETLVRLDRMADKSADNLVKAIERAKKISLNRFIYALGIAHTGEHAAAIISKKFSDLTQIMQAAKEDLEQIHGIGTETAAAVYCFFRDTEHQAVIQSLLDSGVEIRKKQLRLMEE